MGRTKLHPYLSQQEVKEVIAKSEKSINKYRSLWFRQMEEKSRSSSRASWKWDRHLSDEEGCVGNGDLSDRRIFWSTSPKLCDSFPYWFPRFSKVLPWELPSKLLSKQTNTHNELRLWTWFYLFFLEVKSIITNSEGARATRVGGSAQRFCSPSLSHLCLWFIWRARSVFTSHPTYRYSAHIWMNEQTMKENPTIFHTS